MSRWFDWLSGSKYNYAEEMKKLEEMSEEDRLEKKKTETVKLKKDYNLNSKEMRLKNAIVGLDNLGNTCFMNSVLQCLSHSSELREHFLKKEWWNDLNVLSSPSKGVMACEFYVFLEKYWTCDKDAISPSNIKKAFAKIKQSFAGFDQQDAQEFLSFFLDSIHEDLNQIIIKPYEAIEDYKPGTDVSEFLSRAYQMHKNRNCSFIIDQFHGQFYSKIICPEESCRLESITGDPFEILSLNLPDNNKTTLDFFVLPASYEESIEKYQLICAGELNSMDIFKHFQANFPQKKYRRFKQFYFEKLRIVNEFNENECVSVAFIRDSPGYLIICETLDAGISRLVFGEKAELLVQKKWTDSFKLKLQVNINLEFNGIERMIEVPEDISWFEVTLLMFLIHRSVLVEAGVIHDDFTKYPTTRKEAENDFANFNNYLQKTNKPDFMNLSIEGTTYPIDSSYIKLFESASNKTANVKLNFNSSIKLKLRTMKTLTIEPLMPNSKSISLENCLERFTKKETLDQENMWFCPNCKEHRKATKELRLNRLPETLIIHLRRFKKVHHSFGASFSKIKSLVNFPMNLNVNKFMFEPSQIHSYELYAVSNHMGNCGGGHYTAYCKTVSGVWYLFDDEDTRKVKENDVITESAYILFYRKIQMTK